MEAVVEKASMARAYRRVVANKGAPGADGMTVDQLADHLKQHWPTLRERLLAGEYHPSPIRAVEIPKRSAQQAVSAMKDHVAAGHRWVVDLDLQAFFDRVNHDLLMARVARRVCDKRVLRLIRRYQEAGMFQDSLAAPRPRVGR